MQDISKVAIKNLQDRITELEIRVEELEQWREKVKAAVIETEKKLKYWGTK
mgnify:CR=1 FL=1